MISYKQYHWEDNKLFLGKKYTGMFYRPIEDYPDCWQICWDVDPPSFSENFYNLPRVKDNMIKWHQASMNTSVEERPRAAL